MYAAFFGSIGGNMVWKVGQDCKLPSGKLRIWKNIVYQGKWSNYRLPCIPNICWRVSALDLLDEFLAECKWKTRILGIASFIHFHQEEHHFSRPMSLHVSSCVSSSCPFQGVSLKQNKNVLSCKKKTWCSCTALSWSRGFQRSDRPGNTELPQQSAWNLSLWVPMSCMKNQSKQWFFSALRKWDIGNYQKVCIYIRLYYHI